MRKRKDQKARWKDLDRKRKKKKRVAASRMGGKVKEPGAGLGFGG